MIFLPHNIPTSRLQNPRADCDELAPPDFLEVLGPARQGRFPAGRVVGEPRRPLHWAARIRRSFYQLSAKLQNAGRSPRVTR
jgi:hypothetical protein